MRIAALVMLVALLAGCASQQAKENFSYSVLSLQGAPRDAVLSQMGAPDSATDTSNGEILSYRDEIRDKVSGYYDYTFKCQVDVWVEDGRVSNVQYSGNGSHPYYSDIDYCARVYGSR